MQLPVFVLQTSEEFRRLWEVAVNHTEVFVVKIKSSLFQRKGPLHLMARLRGESFGLVSAMLRLILVGPGQDLVYLILNQHKWTQLWLLAYFVTGPKFLALEGDLALKVVRGSPKTVRGELELAAPDVTCSKASKGASWGKVLCLLVWCPSSSASLAAPR